MSGIVNSTGAVSGVIGTTVGTPAAGVSTRNENLYLKYISATTVDIDADYLTLYDSSNIGYVASSVNLTVDITASGTNGLDTGSEATDIWYHIFVIYNGTTTAGLLSTSLTSPTMPSGYTYKKYVGSVENKPDGHLSSFEQYDNIVTVPTLADESAAGSSNGTLTLTGQIPTSAIVVYGALKIKSSGSQRGWMTLYAKAGWGGVNYSTDHAVTNAYTYTSFRLPLVRVGVAGTGNAGIHWDVTSNDTCYIRICGWEYGGII